MSLDNIMTKKLICADKNDSLVKIANIMKIYDIGFLPICEKNKIIGVITDRDIVINIISNDDIDCNISKYINKKIISVNISKNIKDVLNIMCRERVKRIIVEDNNKAVGIISMSDIINQNYIDKLVIDSIKDIWKIGPNIHKYETQIDEFYL